MKQLSSKMAMPDSIFLYNTSLVLAASLSLALAVIIQRFAATEPENRALSVFLVTVCVWSMGHLALAMPVTGAPEMGKMLINAMPLLGASYLHLCMRLIRKGNLRLWLAAYAVAAFISVVSIVAGAGAIGPWHGFQYYYTVNRELWLPVITILVWVGAVVLLFMHRKTAKMGLNRQVTALLYATALGFVAFSGFFFATFKLPVFPYPVFLWAAYPVLVTYAIFRYSTFKANAWAEWITAWSMMVSTGLLLYIILYVVFSLTGVDIAASLWLPLLIIALPPVIFAIFKRQLFFNFANRLIYFKDPLAGEQVEKWREKLEQPHDLESLRRLAQDMVSSYLGQFVGVQIDVGKSFQTFQIISSPRVLFKLEGGIWTYVLEGWTFANPAYMHGGETLARLVADRLNRVPINEIPVQPAPLSAKKTPPAMPRSTDAVAQKTESKSTQKGPAATDESAPKNAAPTPSLSPRLETREVSTSRTSIQMKTDAASEPGLSSKVTQAKPSLAQAPAVKMESNVGVTGVAPQQPEKGEASDKAASELKPDFTAGVFEPEGLDRKPASDLVEKPEVNLEFEPMVEYKVIHEPPEAPPVASGQAVGGQELFESGVVQEVRISRSAGMCESEDPNSLCELFKRVDMLMQDIVQKKPVSTTLLERTGLTMSDVEPFQSPLELHCKSISLAPWLETFISKRKGDRVKISLNAPVTLNVDESELNQALDSLFDLFESYRIELASRVSGGTLEIELVLKDNYDDNAKSDAQFRRDVLSLLAVYSVFAGHRGHVRYRQRNDDVQDVPVSRGTGARESYNACVLLELPITAQGGE